MNNKRGFWIGGKHSVESVIKKNKRTIIQIVTLQPNEFLNKKNINYEIKNDKFFNKIFAKTNIAHQGIAAMVSTLPNVQIEDISEDKNIVMLDGITDPMNIGSIIRNCIAFGIKSIIVRDREFNEKSVAMIKASSGTIEEIQICQVANLNNAINQLKEKNYWVVCLDSHSEQAIENFKWNEKNLIIFGSEGYGISHLIKKNADYRIKISIEHNVESLNVSNAAAITLYHIFNSNK